MCRMQVQTTQEKLCCMPMVENRSILFKKQHRNLLEERRIGEFWCAH